MQQTLPSLSTMKLPVGTSKFAPQTAVGARLSVDATRELAKCANGELVSHDVVRDGIDALLQLKRASFDHTAKQEGNVNVGEKKENCGLVRKGMRFRIFQHHHGQ